MGTSAVTPIHIRVQELREAKGWSQAELPGNGRAAADDLSYRGESGSITLANLERLADALGVNQHC